MYIATHIYKSRHAAHVHMLILLTIVLIATVACDQPNSRMTGNQGGLSITIGQPEGSQRLSLLPDTSMEPKFYQISGTGPDDEEFKVPADEGTTDVYGLTAGEWKIEVTARNRDEFEIGYGSDRTSVEPARMAHTAITVRALAGTGSLSLSASWPAEEVAAPSLEATLVDSDGQESTLAFEDNGAGSAVYLDESIDAGYYIFTLQLYDGEHSIAGAVKTVRIVNDALTEGIFDFEDLNYPTGSVDLEIVPELNEPLEVAVSGGASVLAFGESMTVNASVANSEDEGISFYWFLNGTALSAGEAIELGADLSPGSYRLDVIAHTDDGQRSGSTTFSFVVE